MRRVYPHGNGDRARKCESRVSRSKRGSANGVTQSLNKVRNEAGKIGVILDANEFGTICIRPFLGSHKLGQRFADHAAQFV
jgi:hypothetical protein